MENEEITPAEAFKAAETIIKFARHHRAQAREVETLGRQLEKTKELLAKEKNKKRVLENVNYSDGDDWVNPKHKLPEEKVPILVIVAHWPGTRIEECRDSRFYRSPVWPDGKYTHVHHNYIVLAWKYLTFPSWLKEVRDEE